MIFYNVNMQYVTRFPRSVESKRGVEWFNDHFNYDSVEGRFFYKKQGSNKRTIPGKEAIPTKLFKYQSELFWHGKGYNAARVAYILMTGEIPNVVLPLNGNIADLRWENLVHLDKSDVKRYGKRHDIDSYTFDLTKTTK